MMNGRDFITYAGDFITTGRDFHDDQIFMMIGQDFQDNRSRIS